MAINGKLMTINGHLMVLFSFGNRLALLVGHRLALPSNMFVESIWIKGDDMSGGQKWSGKNRAKYWRTPVSGEKQLFG